MRLTIAFVLLSAILLAGFYFSSIRGRALVTETPSQVISLWPEKPPGPSLDVGEERNFTKAIDKLIAGKPIIKLGNVATPELHLFLPPVDERNGTSVLVCPGGGFNILAWDLEGTEVAEWLNSLGITAAVLKYRVPTKDHELPWKMPVQDAQRALSLLRANAEEWNLDRERVGILGFSAGGTTAVRVCAEKERIYEQVDSADSGSCRPNFSILVYAAWMANDELNALHPTLEVDETTPPSFLVHAFDDHVPVAHSQIYFSALKAAGVPSELHICDAGGHGFGLRPDERYPITMWPKLCTVWLEQKGWIEK